MGSALVEGIFERAWHLDDAGAVVVDVSAADALMDHLDGRPIVIGSTGHSETGFEAMREAAKVAPVLYVPNFSAGIGYLEELAKRATGLIGECDRQIFETHHKNKRDCPSGTALRLAQLLGIEKISSQREDDVIGEHKVIFRFGSEEIEICHKVKSRKAFVDGALSCIEWIATQAPGFYTMDDVLCKT